MKAKQNNCDIEVGFDVGHSSIGWAVFQNKPSLEIKGCGAVTFRADDCLASQRRAYRRQRRHIRSTRQRIARMKALLRHLDVMTDSELERPGCAWPWKLAAGVLCGGPLLIWPELWDVLRWYAHNRGYDANRRWSAIEEEAEKEDAEKVQNAHALLEKHGTRSMAETFCRELKVDPLGKLKSSMIRFKGLNAAFPRTVVEEEVRRILDAHIGHLKCVDAALERVLIGKDGRDAEAWKAISCPEIHLPGRYQGGLLFGQLVPRFDNRIISTCPISGQKVPSRKCVEFLNFRWAMQLANIRIAKPGETELRPLAAADRVVIDALMRDAGHLTEKELQKAVRSQTGSERDNLETMFMHPDAKKSLLLDPVRKLEKSDKVQMFWNLIPERLQKRLRGHWRRGKATTLGDIRNSLLELEQSVEALDAMVQRRLDTANTRKGRKETPLTREKILAEIFRADFHDLSGRAVYARPVLRKAYEEVLAGKHPKEEGGCLFVTEKMRQAELQRKLEEQTNNHLIRHRLLILQRVMRDIVKEYANGQKERVAQITIEVNRDLREMSGKTAKEVAQDMGSRLSDHHKVASRLEEAFAGKNIQVTAGLIRKARIAEDLDWTCPYTGQKFEPVDLITRRVDKDHIVPRSDRLSDSLDSLVITFSAVNKWKGKRTALQFVTEEQGKSVPEMPNLSIMSLKRYEELVDALDQKLGHEDDKRRKRNRKRLMMLGSYDEPEFTPRDLTVTSQLVRLGAQVLRRGYSGASNSPVIVSLPGSVTGAVRRSWNLLGCLSEACPRVLDETGKVKTKTEIRDLTHLHHALDACVLGLASHFLPNDGKVWELLVKRRLNESERRHLAALDLFRVTEQGNFDLKDLDISLKTQIRQRLAEKRVVQHIPASMDGLRAEETVWRVVDPTKDDYYARMIRGIKAKEIPDAIDKKKKQVWIVHKIRKGKAVPKPPSKLLKDNPDFWIAYDVVPRSKLIGLNPDGKEGEGKLHHLQACKVIGDNFGIALVKPKPAIIPFHKVWPRLEKLKEANGNKVPQVLRNGQLIRVPRGSRAGIWQVLSTKSTEAYGLALDLASPGQMKLERGNAPVEKLLQDGMEIVQRSLLGIDSSAIKSAIVKRRPRKNAQADGQCPTTSST